MVNKLYCKGDGVEWAYRGEFYGDQRLTGSRGSDLNAPRIEPLYMHSRESLVPQLVDKIGAGVVRMDVEVSQVVGFDSSGEKREMFENVSEGRDEIEDGLLHRMVRLGYRWEEIVDRGPDEGNQEVQGVDLCGVWTGKTESCRGSHSD